MSHPPDLKVMKMMWADLDSTLMCVSKYKKYRKSPDMSEDQTCMLALSKKTMLFVTILPILVTYTQ